MDISGVSTSLNTAGQVSSPTRGELQHWWQDKTSRGTSRAWLRGRRGLALGIFKQELALKAWFKARHSLGHVEAPVSTNNVADETLGAARQLVAESPSTAAKSLISFKARVEQAASYVREVIGSGDDGHEIDDVLAKVDAGLDELENDVASYRESSASVLSVDTRSRQRSTIQIRTQEGDVVRFSLKRVDSMSATDVAYSDAEMSVTSTEVSVSSRSRMMMTVEGDLNDAELAAIQNVFAQAEMIADEFFEGDIGAAFNVAQGFEFDTEQLARVNMRFRMREATSIAYAETKPTIPVGRIDPPVVALSEVESPAAVESPTKLSAEAAPEPQPLPLYEVPNGVFEVKPVEQPEADSSASPLGASALENFLDALGVFLRSVGEGFANGNTESSFRYHYSESFKLEMLKAVLHTVAPSDSLDAADNATKLIDGISEPSVESD